MREYKVKLRYPLDSNVESYLYAHDIFIVSGKYGSKIIKVSTSVSKEDMLDTVDIEKILEYD